MDLGAVGSNPITRPTYFLRVSAIVLAVSLHGMGCGTAEPLPAF